MKELVIEGFGGTKSTQGVMSVAGFGQEGCGKTRLGMTMPTPFAVVCLDQKTVVTVEKVARELGLKEGRDYVLSQNFVKIKNPRTVLKMEVEEAKKYFRERTNQIMDTCYRAIDHKDIRGLMVDTGTMLSDEVFAAHFGLKDRVMARDRGPFNKEMEQFYAYCSTKNLYVTHMAKEKWVGEQPSGVYVLDGWKSTGYKVNAVVRLQRKASGDGEFQLDVVQAQANAELFGKKGLSSETGLTGEDINWMNLAMQVFPDSEPEWWA